MGLLTALKSLLFESPEQELALETGFEEESAHEPKATILVIDDDQGVLDMVRQTLQDNGYNVLTSTTGPKGLDMLRYTGGDVDVLLLDYNMPRFNGAQTLQYVRKISRNVKVLAVTGVESAQLPQFFKTGVDKLLQKPFRGADLLGAISELAPVPQNARNH